jgi:hypothetical protein
MFVVDCGDTGGPDRIAVERGRIQGGQRLGVSSQLDPVTIDVAAQNAASILGNDARSRVRRALDLEQRRTQMNAEMARGVTAASVVHTVPSW